ncbi:MAG: hypothetical protein HQM16_08590 [Deltaproteobacteria bacterium]|nr:hypothetical protein [Deltaproteobacteria bacterium]
MALIPNYIKPPFLYMMPSLFAESTGIVIWSKGIAAELSLLAMTASSSRAKRGDPPDAF